MTPLLKPVRRMVAIEGNAWVISLEPGSGSHVGQALLTLRRKRYRRRSRYQFVLSDVVRQIERADRGLPQMELFLHTRVRHVAQG